jgi:hypothetical protein
MTHDSNRIPFVIPSHTVALVMGVVCNTQVFVLSLESATLPFSAKSSYYLLTSSDTGPISSSPEASGFIVSICAIGSSNIRSTSGFVPTLQLVLFPPCREPVCARCSNLGSTLPSWAEKMSL